MHREILTKAINNFSGSRIMVIGDLMLDVFIWGIAKRISPEAPVPIVEVRKESFCPGGSANVAVNICSLGGHPDIVGVTGEDGYGRQLLDLLSETGGNINSVKVCSRPTTLKTRIIAHQQQIVRIDKEVITELDKATSQALKDSVSEGANSVDAIIVEDYGKGVINQSFLAHIVKEAAKHDKPVIMDPKKGANLDFSGITLLTPNRLEAYAMVGVPFDEEEGIEEIESVGNAILERWDIGAVLITLGEHGMCLLQRDVAEPFVIPTAAQEVYDVSGAGDTVVATIAMAMASGANIKEASELANIAAGIVVGEVGTAVVKIEELKKAVF